MYFYKIQLYLLLIFPFMANAGPAHFLFITNWEIKAPLERVWEMIDKTEDWPDWWKGFEQAEIIETGNANDIGKIIHYKVKSFLPFALSFDLKTTTKEKYKRITGSATGDLEGIGEWTFEERNDITYIQYRWDVTSTKKIVNFLSPVLRWFFEYNHSLVMHWGAKRLAKRLQAPLLKG